MILTTTDFDVGVLLESATESRGINTLASGKYVAIFPLGIEYGTTFHFSANLSMYNFRYN